MSEESEKPRRAAPKEKTASKSGGKAQSSGGSVPGPRSSTHGASRSQEGAPRSGRPQGENGGRPRDGQQTAQRPGGPSNQVRRPQGDRPQGGNRPRDGHPQGGQRPRGDRPASGGRPQGDRPAYRDQKQPADDDDSFRGLGKDTGVDYADSAPAGVKMSIRLPKKSDDYTRSYRGTSARATSGQRGGPNRQGGRGRGKPSSGSRSKQNTARQSMLSMHKIMPFKYDMNQILATTSMDPSKASGFLATVVAKASRVSVREAKTYVATFLEAGDITRDENDRFCRLLDRYSKYR